MSWFQKRFWTILRSLLAFYWLALLVATHLPPSNEPPKVSDKLEHFIAYGLLAGMLHLSLWPKRWPIAKLAIVVLMTCMGYGGFDELTQPFFRRTCDIRDWTADVIGASIAITFMTAASVFIPKRFTGD